MASDIDADGEEDVEMIADPAEEENASTEKEELEEDEEDVSANAEPDAEEADSSKENGEDEDAEGDDEEDEEEEEEEEEDEEDDDDDDDDEAVEEGAKHESDKAEVGTEYHGAVKLPDGKNLESEGEDGEEDEEDGEEEDSSDEESTASQGGSEDSSDETSSESGAENDWEGEQSVEGEVGQADIKARNDCIFCGQDEEHDPSEEFEEYLACAVCGDNAHRQCARDKGSFKDELHDATSWRCPSCTENGLEVGTAAASDDEQDNLSLQRRLSISSARITRDLLPATKGSSKPGSHSIFNTLILDDDPGDGARALRKRKSSEATEEQRSRASSKRPKTSDSRQEHALSPVASGRAARSTTAASRTRRASAAAIEHREEAPGSSTLSNVRPQRQRRQKEDKAGNVRVVRQTKSSIILALRVDLSKITFRPPKRKRGPGRRRASQANAASTSLHNIAPYTTPYYAFHDRENDDSKKPPYGGILGEDEADTSMTMPAPDDRAKFEAARQRAEEEWKRRSVAAEAAQEIKGRASQKVSGPPSKIKSIIFGKWEIETWYAAPYPEEYSRNRVLYICEFCLKYMGSDFVAWRHKLKCPCKYPPGDEIYRDGSISVFEVDGRKNPAYCQNLCLLAKLFLGSKTLYYDVEPFLFYIMTEYDKNGYHFVGYFSKEKRPSSMNNVSCILTMPHHQRKGYGHLLIDFSYLLTRKENRTGSPEKPLSDMGLVSYRNYWRLQLCYLLIDAKPGQDSMSIKAISDQLGMTPDDVISQLEALRVLVRDPVTKAYAFRLDKAYFKETIEKWEAKGHQRLNADRLVWTPYIMSRTSNLAIFDRPPIATVAPREDEDEEDEDEDIVPEEGVQQELAAEKAAAVAVAAAASALANSTNGVATSDFATGSACDDKDEPMQGVMEEQPLSSPAKAPTLALINGVIASHSPVPAPQSPVPPWRYELWPPVPGTIYRSRRGGYRPKGSRITPHGPIFGARSNNNAPATTPRGSRTSLRVSNKAASTMTSAHLGKGLDGTISVASGKNSVKDSPSARRSTRSRVGSPGQDKAPTDEEVVVGGEEEEESGSGGENVKLEGEARDEGDDDDDDDDDGAESEASSDSSSAENEDLDADIDVDVDGDAEADGDYEDAEEDQDGEDDGDEEDEDVPMDD